MWCFSTIAGLLVVFCLILLIAILFIPTLYCFNGFESVPIPVGLSKDDPHQLPKTSRFTIEKVNFRSHNTLLIGDLYVPHSLYKSRRPPNDGYPCIIMAPGIGATKDFALFKYAREFASAEFCVFLFDYRTFGESEGEPRHCISPKNHCFDIMSAVHYIRSRNEVINPDRIALWGSSYGGGHVLSVAGGMLVKLNHKRAQEINREAGGSLVTDLSQKRCFAKNLTRLFGITCVVAHLSYIGVCPEMEDPRIEFKKRGLRRVMLGMLGAVSDILRSYLGMQPLYAKLIGTKEESSSMLALNYTEDNQITLDSYFASHPQHRNNDWRNGVALRSLLPMSRYRPMEHIPYIAMPVLYIAADKDVMCPKNRIYYAANHTANQQLLSLDMNHFDSAMPQNFEKIIKTQLDFFYENL